MCRIELLRGTANLACPCVIAVSAVQETVEKVQEEQQNCKTAESRCGGTQAVVRWECLYLFTVCLQGLSFKWSHCLLRLLRAVMNSSAKQFSTLDQDLSLYDAGAVASNALGRARACWRIILRHRSWFLPSHLSVWVGLCMACASVQLIFQRFFWRQWLLVRQPRRHCKLLNVTLPLRPLAHMPDVNLVVKFDEDIICGSLCCNCAECMAGFGSKDETRRSCEAVERGKRTSSHPRTRVARGHAECWRPCSLSV